MNILSNPVNFPREIFFRYNRLLICHTKFQRQILSLLKIKFNMKPITLIISITLISLTISIKSIAQTRITVKPQTTVEVGEEVYFDAVYYAQTISDTLEFEWDFGDGYRMYIDTADGNPFESGLAVLHYFMKPGVYNVKLKASRYYLYLKKPVLVNVMAVDSVTITVTGEEPVAGFELLHAPFHGRVAQYLYAIVPAGYTTSQVVAQVEKVGGGYSEQLTGEKVDTMQRFLLRNAQLPQGDYIITVQLKNGESIVSQIREKFSKPYDGPPAIGINENNAFVINGQTLYFPLGPFMCDLGNLPLWRNVSNSLHTEGYYPNHTRETWKDYIAKGFSQDLMAVGPTRWSGSKAEKPGFYVRNSHIDSIVRYVQLTRDEQGLFAWNWDDEPELGGRWAQVPTQVLAAWAYRTYMEDPHHLTTIQLYGYDYQRYRDPRKPNTMSAPYMYRFNAPKYGGKRHFFGDFYTHDAYPMEAQEHTSFKDTKAGVFELWFENLESFRWVNCDLIPLGVCVETQDVTSCNKLDNLDTWDAGPNPYELRTELWGAIVHGMKYIIYFDYFTPTPADNFSAMGELKEAVSALAPVILSEPSARTMTHNCNSRGKRVDIMIREYGGDVYVFAVRVSEPESEWDEVNEPETINFELNTGTDYPVVYDELAKYAWKYIKIDTDEGQKDFNITVPEGSIMPGNIIISAVIASAASKNYPDFLTDQFTGKKYPTALDMVGNLKYGYDDGSGNIIPQYTGTKGLTGTVNYSTGQIQFSFTEGIPSGKGFVQIAYAPGNRQPKLIPISDGIIHDKLERNAVRIYRLTNTLNIADKSGSSTEISLGQNYPNPFTHSTRITYEIPCQAKVVLKIYDLLGREIKTLVDEYQTSGFHTVSWDGTDAYGMKAPGGIYCYRISTDQGYKDAKKLVLVR
jgi:PKD repeat protein